MNVHHSPTKTGGGSQPDLSRLSSMETDSLITFRKRKHPLPEKDCDCSHDITEIKSELSRMTSILEKYVESNQQMMNKLQMSINEVKTDITEMKSTNEQTASMFHANINEIKTQIDDIKSTSLIITSEQNKIKTQVTLMENKIASGENRLKSLEVKPSTPQFVNQACLSEQMLREFKERNNREKNIIIVGLPEQTSSTTEERISNDEAAVMSITCAVDKDIPKPIKVVRVGKFTPGRNRRVKVCFNTPGPAKQLLRSKDKLPGHGKFDELKCILESISTTVHVILLSETWIRNEIQALQLCLPNYTHYYNYRSDMRGGGVSAYVHNNLKHSLSESNYTGGNNYLWIQLEKYALQVGVIYKPGDTNFKNFLEVYDLQLQQRQRAIVFGDFNIDLLTKDKNTKQYIYTTKEAGYKILNKVNRNYTTRDSSTKKSILDHVSTNLENNDFHMALIDSAMSDHKQIHLQMKKFKPLIQGAGLDDLHSDYTLLECTIKQYINKSKTSRTKILNLPQKEWINNDILSELNLRNHLWIELKRDPNNDSLKADFKSKRDYTAKLIQNTKNNYHYSEFMKCTYKPKKMWKLINDLASNKIKQSCAPPKLSIDSKIITSTSEICEVFNQYFSTIGSLLAEQIPKYFHDNFTQALPNNTIKGELSTLDPCTPEEIDKIISNLDVNSSAGLDG
ncbi:putative tick transposon, partial [Operophtera brumata]